MNKKYHGGSYHEEDDADNNTGSNSEPTPDYAFDGFTIELNEKISLTPTSGSK